MKKPLFFLILLLAAPWVTNAQIAPTSKSGRQELLQGRKAELHLSYPVTVFLSCESSEEGIPYSLDSGEYYVSLSNCGRGGDVFYKYLTVCTQAADYATTKRTSCYTRKLDGGSRYVLRSRSDQHIIDKKTSRH